MLWAENQSYKRLFALYDRIMMNLLTHYSGNKPLFED